MSAVEITTTRLLAKIGALTVENDVLREQLAELQRELDTDRQQTAERS